MGTNCSRCDILQSETQNELTRKSLKPKADNTYAASFISNDNDSYSNQEQKIIMIQKQIRRFLTQNNSIKSHVPNVSLEKLDQGDTVTKSKNFEYISPQKSDKNYVENYPINDLATYTGELKDGVQNGKGLQIWKDGAKYEGEWVNGKANGYGVFYHIDGDIYKGMWKDDKANGEGTYISADGVNYEGHWEDDFQNGYGIETWKDGSSYKGNYVLGKKQG